VLSGLLAVVARLRGVLAAAVLPPAVLPGPLALIAAVAVLVIGGGGLRAVLLRAGVVGRQGHPGVRVVLGLAVVGGTGTGGSVGRLRHEVFLFDCGGRSVARRDAVTAHRADRPRWVHAKSDMSAPLLRGGSVAGSPCACGRQVPCACVRPRA